jgi:hypothetical protein
VRAQDLDDPADGAAVAEDTKGPKRFAPKEWIGIVEDSDQLPARVVAAYSAERPDRL